MAQIGPDIYCSVGNGIFVDVEADDDGADIVVEIEKQGVDFGSSLKKQIVGMFLHMATAGTVTVSIASDVGSGFNVSSAYPTSTMRGHKIILPRGVFGRNFTFNIQNNLGATIRLAEIEAMVTVSRRHA
jgi:hypothetical protein